jgi:hypothetical protein
VSHSNFIDSSLALSAPLQQFVLGSSDTFSAEATRVNLTRACDRCRRRGAIPPGTLAIVGPAFGLRRGHERQRSIKTRRTCGHCSRAVLAR